MTTLLFGGSLYITFGLGATHYMCTFKTPHISNLRGVFLASHVVVFGLVGFTVTRRLTGLDKKSTWSRYSDQVYAGVLFGSSYLEGFTVGHIFKAALYRIRK